MITEHEKQGYHDSQRCQYTVLGDGGGLVKWGLKSVPPKGS